MPEGRLFESFECGPGLKLAAHERLVQLQFDHINSRLERLEQLLQRLEKRLWLAVYGVAAVVLAQVAESFLVAVP